MKKKTLIITIALILWLSIIYKVATFVLFLYAPASSINKSVVLLIEKGSTLTSIAKDLKNKNLIKNIDNFILFSKIRKISSKIQAGEFRFNRNMTPLEIIDILLNSKPVRYKFTIPEGFNIYQIAEILDKKYFIKSTEIFISLTKNKKFITELGLNADSLEGYLFPDTYVVSRPINSKKIIKMMYKRFKQEFAKISLKYSSSLSKHEIITLASIIEKETADTKEQKTISSVFHNRLKKRMRLQSDPTTIYGVWHEYKGNIQRKHLRAYNPYNTYVIFGLPKGPIACPGAGAIKSVFNPEKTNFLYFVSRNNGTHKFSKTYKEHSRAVYHYQIKRRK